MQELALTLASYSPNCAAGTLCGLSGQTLNMDAFQVSTPNGATSTRRNISELVTLSTGGATSDTTANLLPANSIIEAVVARVTTTISTAQIGN